MNVIIQAFFDRMTWIREHPVSRRSVWGVAENNFSGKYKKYFTSRRYPLPEISHPHSGRLEVL